MMGSIAMPIWVKPTASLILALVLGLVSKPQNRIFFAQNVSGSGPVPALVSGQTAGVQGTGNPQTLSLPSNDTTGNAVIVLEGVSPVGSALPPVLTGASFTLVSASACSSSGYSLYAYVAPNVTGGNKQISVTNAGGATIELHLLEFSGVATSSPVDVTVSCVTGASAPNPTLGGSVTPSQANDLVLGFMRMDTAATTLSASSPFTILVYLSDNFASEYYVPSSTSAIAASFGNTVGGQSYAAFTFALKP